MGLLTEGVSISLRSAWREEPLWILPQGGLVAVGQPGGAQGGSLGAALRVPQQSLWNLS